MADMNEGYTNRQCAICKQLRNFKYLPREKDAYGRILMVCTRCSSKIAIPGQAKPTWKEMMERD